MIDPDKSPLLSAAFSPDVAPITKATASIGAGVTLPQTPIADAMSLEFMDLSIADWSSLIMITYGLVCLFIALPKIFHTIRDLRNFIRKD